jgi:hypothetical protein
MNTIGLNQPASLFRHFAAALSAPSGRTTAGNEGHGGVTIGTIRDKLTLSPEGRLAYESHAHKLNKVPQPQAAEVADANEGSPSAPVLQEQSDGECSVTYDGVVYEVDAAFQAKFQTQLGLSSTQYRVEGNRNDWSVSPTGQLISGARLVPVASSVEGEQSQN